MSHSRPDQNIITDQKVIAGIGNAYSDEILHVAKRRRCVMLTNTPMPSSARCTTQ